MKTIALTTALLVLTQTGCSESGTQAEVQAREVATTPKPYQLDRTTCGGLSETEIEAYLNMQLDQILPASRVGNCHFTSPSDLSLDIKHWPHGIGKKRFHMAKETAENWGGVQPLDFGEDAFLTKSGIQLYVLLENGGVVEVSTQPENLKAPDALVKLTEIYLTALSSESE